MLRFARYLSRLNVGDALAAVTTSATANASICALVALCLTACGGGRFATPYATGRYEAAPVQCVPYAREISGVRLYGDAHSWWDKAPPAYAYGRMPQPGAVMVLARTARMTHGHLAVVRNIVGPRAIDVTHSNWGWDRDTRRIIYDSMRVTDVSPLNDWSQARFWNKDAGVFGAPYAVQGFIYNAPPVLPAPPPVSMDDVLAEITSSAVLQ